MALFFQGTVVEDASHWNKLHLLRFESLTGMLILTRKPGESVRIGDDITVTVLGVTGNQVRIGIKAPREIGVHREQVYEKIQQELDHSRRSGADDQARP